MATEGEETEETGRVKPWKASKIPRTSEMVAVHWPVGERAVWDEFVKICRVDGHSASAEIRVFVAGQVKKRSPGNPQTPLERFQKRVSSRKLQRGRHVWHTFGNQGELVKTEVEDIP